MNACGRGALAIDPTDPQTIYFGVEHNAASTNEADPDRLHHLFDRSIAYRNEFELIRIDAIVELRRVLTPEQRKIFMQIVQERQSPF